jgi:hypothetical protein
MVEQHRPTEKFSSNANDVLTINDRVSNELYKEMGMLNSGKGATGKDEYSTASSYLPKVAMYDSLLDQNQQDKSNTLTDDEHAQAVDMLKKDGSAKTAAGTAAKSADGGEKPLELGKQQDDDMFKDPPSCVQNTLDNRNIMDTVEKYFSQMDENGDGFVTAGEIIKFKNSMKGMKQFSMNEATELELAAAQEQELSKVRNDGAKDSVGISRNDVAAARRLRLSVNDHFANIP